MCHSAIRQSILSFFLLLALTATSYAQPSADEGKTLFRNACAQCHNKNMKSDLTGPALGGVEERWADYPQEDLYNWIRNSQAMIASGHPRATELWAEWKPTVMNPYPDYTDDQIASLLLYIDQEYTKVPVASVGGPAGAGGASDQGSNQFLYWILFIILAVVAVVLARIITNLN